MRRPFVIALLVINLLVWGGAGALLMYPRIRDIGAVLPTLAVLPSHTPTVTWTPSRIPSATPSFTPTATATTPPTLTPTSTPTLATRVLEITAIMQGVYLPPTLTPFPFGMTILLAPPEVYEPLPDATDTAPPFDGWFSFESDYPLVRYIPPWTPRLSESASRGQYHRTEDITGRASFPFAGEGLRLRYVAAQNMGMFDVIVDGIVLDTIDAYAATLVFPGTRVYTLHPGQHLLELRSAGKNPASEGYVIGLDAIQVFRADAHTLILQPQNFTPTPTMREAARIELIAAPPTLAPTATPLPPQIVRASVVIAYDENGNGVVDPAEGVAGISVRVVETPTNQVIASGFTDARGYAYLEVVSAAPTRVVVPYFGEAWDVSNNRNGAPNTFTLLLDAANQPGLIP
ncbi:MAG: hypothetical protein IAE80_21115 [Anaerolinea sp.]|nr:hypothetical protein [Anaerolinea sp.]